MTYFKDIVVQEALGASAPALYVSPLETTPQHTSPAFYVPAGSPSQGTTFTVTGKDSFPPVCEFFVPCPSYCKTVFTVNASVESRYIYDGARSCGIVISVGSDRREAVQCSKETKKVCKSLSPKVNFCARSYRVLRL